ncbi:hypothetical protein NMG60_11008948 [Bertholletia excelsa]
MGLLPCPLPCRTNDDDSDSHSQSDSNHLHSSDSSASSLSSQPSLPSVPSLTPPLHLHEPPSTAVLCQASTLRGHSSYVLSLALSGKNLYSGSSCGDIRRWSRDPSPVNSSVPVASACGAAVKSIVVLGNKLFTAHQDHKIRVWKIDNESQTAKYDVVATLPTLGDRFAKLFSAGNYVEVRRHKKCTWVHHVDGVSALALSKDGSLLYSVSWDRTFKVWRTSDFKCLESVWKAHDDAINAVVLSSDGVIFTGSADKKIKVWKKHEGEKKHRLIATLEKHKSAVNALALSSDGSVLYSGACDRSIIVWQKDDGAGGEYMTVAGALRGHTKAILCLAVVDDLVCSGSADKTVRVWRKGIGMSYSCLAVLEGHRGSVKCLVAAVDSSARDSWSEAGTGYRVYSGGLDCETKVWQIWVPFS